MLATLVAVALIAPGQVQNDLPSLGTNLAEVSDSTTEWPFVDVFKVSRPWVSQTEGSTGNQGVPLEIDENGNVKSLKPGQFAETVIYSGGMCPKGKYTLTWEGDGDFDAHNGSTLTAAGQNKAIVELQGDNGISLTLKRVDANNPPHNIRLLMPGYEDVSDDEPYHPVFMQRMSLYRSLRFMDWGRTNGSKQQKWTDRALPSLTTFATDKGVPYEVMIDLANRKSAIPWVCVPHLADDDYVRNLAKLFKDRLRPEFQIAVEYSNECWNLELAQAKYCADQGKKLKLSDDDSVAGLRFYSQRSVEVFSIFKEVFGGETRLVRVLSSNATDKTSAETVLEWKNAYLHADALAIAPYFGSSFGAPQNAGKTKAGSLDDLFAGLKTEVEGPLRDSLFSYAGLALQNRVRLLAYSGGQNLVATGSDRDDATLNTLFDDANRDPRMATVYTSHLKSWRGAGGSMFVHDTDCAPFSKDGRRGTFEHQSQDPQTSSKNRALVQYALFPDR